MSEKSNTLACISCVFLYLGERQGKLYLTVDSQSIVDFNRHTTDASKGHFSYDLYFVSYFHVVEEKVKKLMINLSHIRRNHGQGPKIVKRPPEQENLAKIKSKTKKSEKRMCVFLEINKSRIQYLVAKLT